MATTRSLSFFIILFFCPTSRAELNNRTSSSSNPNPNPNPAYAAFTFDATFFPMESDYDYIVVGGGTSGCPLAATLSLSHRVLLLERGGPTTDFPSLSSQEGFLETLSLTSEDSPAQSFVSDDGVPNARGRVLGGSSAINAGFYSRAHPSFFTRDSGIRWDANMVNEAYEWVERAVAFKPELGRWQSAVRDGLVEVGVKPFNGFTVRHVEGTKVGATTFDASGRRHSAVDLLALANGENLRVATRATVERILLTSNRLPSGPRWRNHHQPSAIGVAYRDRVGLVHRAMVRPSGEVILSAGCLGSPQLLLLSGIGPRPYLASWGIPLSVHSPNVGQYLYDNPRNGISIIPSAPLNHSLIQVVGITNSGTFLEAASNVVPLRSPLSLAPVYITVASIIEKVASPTSVGFLHLASLNVRDNPFVRFNYFATRQDLDRCIIGVRKIAEVLESRSMEEFTTAVGWWGEREFRIMGVPLPKNRTNNGEMGDFCKMTVSTIWHYHGGCLVGKVVDAEYRVMGVDGLRVVDGSTFAVSPGTNPQATVMMMGRYMGRRISRERMMTGSSTGGNGRKGSRISRSRPF